MKAKLKLIPNLKKMITRKRTPNRYITHTKKNTKIHLEHNAKICKLLTVIKYSAQNHHGGNDNGAKMHAHTIAQITAHYKYRT